MKEQNSKKDNERNSTISKLHCVNVAGGCFRNSYIKCHYNLDPVQGEILIKRVLKSGDFVSAKIQSKYRLPTTRN